jgi:hypothetical protein
VTVFGVLLVICSRTTPTTLTNRRSWIIEADTGDIIIPYPDDTDLMGQSMGQ